MSTKPTHRAPDEQSNRPPGDQLLKLTCFNFLAGLVYGSIFFAPDLASSHNPVDRFSRLGFALSGGGMTLSVICLVIGLLVRQPWSWRLAVGTQAVAVACQLFLAMLPLYVVGTRSGDELTVLASLVVSAVAMIPIIVSLLGLFYLMRPNVGALFHVESSIQSNRSAGVQLLILTLLNLLAALELVSSHDRDDRFAALGAALSRGGMTLFAICLAIGLFVSQPWSWRLAVGTQAVSVACQLFSAAMLALYMTETASGEAAYSVLGGLLILIPIIVSLVGLFYLIRPNVIALFHAMPP